MQNYKPEGWLIDTSENKSNLKSIASLEECLLNQVTLEAKAILCDSQHNLVVDLGCLKGVILRSEGAIGIESGQTKDIALIARVGKPVCFKIVGFTVNEYGKKIALLSRRSAQMECKEHYISSLLPGDVIDAKVTHFESFGCFVDIGCGIPSLLPIDMISVSRISHPKDRFSIGQNIKTVIKKVEEDRVFLTHKELLGTWEENCREYSPGETVPGIIRSIEDYGVFVELKPNLAGLAEPYENAKIAGGASVYIKNLLPERMKIKLIIVDSFEIVSEPVPMKYFFIDPHMDTWRYSPEGSLKIIETVF